MRNAFTLIELLVIIGIMGLMVTVGIVNVRTGQGAARTRGAARDIFAVIRHARSTALVTMQPSVITYSCVIEDEEPVAKVEIHGAEILNSENSAGRVQSLSGDPIEGMEETDGAEARPSPEAGKEETGGETLEDVLFAPISAEIVKGMRLKVEVGDELASLEDAAQKKPRVSVFSNVDYLIGKFRKNRDGGKKKESGGGSEKTSEVGAAPSDPDVQKEVSVVWETNGRTEPHQVWIYPDGLEPRDGLLIRVDRFGGVKVVSGDGREEDE